MSTPVGAWPHDGERHIWEVGCGLILCLWFCHLEQTLRKCCHMVPLDPHDARWGPAHQETWNYYQSDGQVYLQVLQNLLLQHAAYASPFC